MALPDDFVTALYDFGIARDKVEVRPGYRKVNQRGEWTHGKPIAQVDHHFANGINAKDLDLVSMCENGYAGGPAKPVVNNLLGRGKLYLVCWYPTGHPGKGSRRVLDDIRKGIAPSGDAAARGLPDDLSQDDAENLYAGTEVHNPGDGTPLTDWQMDTLIKSNAAIAQVCGFTAAACIQHREHSARKPDIHRAALNAHTFRSQVAALLNTDAPVGDEFDRATPGQVLEAVCGGIL